MRCTHSQTNQNNRRNQHYHLMDKQQGKLIEMSPKMSHQNKKEQRFSIWTTSLAILMCLIACGVTKTNAVTASGLSPSAAAAASYHYPSRPLLLHWHHLARREAPPSSSSPTEEEEVGLPPLPAASLVQDETSSSSGGSGQKDNTVEDINAGRHLCLLDGVLVAEASAVCEKQIGCRAIQKTGHCCPDYKCDCEKDGKTYSNGDKLVDPDTPCKVCYCQGGEILCSSVTCFHRDDCTPKYIPGRCCPEYDNCPVLNAQTNKTTTASPSPQSPQKPEMAQSSALNPKITIKEITKPIEIRITDDNKAPIHQMLKPSTTSTTTTSTTTSTTSSPTTSSTTSTSSTTTTTTTTTTTPAPLSTTTTAVATNHEPSSTPLKLATSMPHTKVSSSADVNHESSSSTKVTAIHHSTSSLLSGNGNLKLSASVAYASSTEHPSLTDGIDGDRTLTTLLEGDGSVAEREIGGDPSKVNKREYLLTTEIGSSLDSDDYAIEPEAVFPVADSEGGAGSGELVGEPETAGSDNIYHIIMTTGGPKGSNPSTEGYVGLKGASTEGFNSDLNSGVHEAHTRNQPTTEGLYSSTDGMDQSSTESSTKYTTESSLSSTTTSTDTMSSTTENHHMDEEDGVIPMEPNPAYPSLPEDDFSLRFPLTDNDDVGEADLKDEPRTIGGSSSVFDAMKSTKHLDEPNNEGSGSGAGMIMDGLASSTTDSSSTSTESPLMPEKIALMYSTEDLSDETKISNTTDFQLEKMLKGGDMENDTGSGLDSLEMAADETLTGLYGSGSGDYMSSSPSSGPTKKYREPTTPRPTKRPLDLDIDELGSAWGDDGNSTSLLEDPKLDAESLKVDENKDAGGVVKIDAKGAKDNVVAIKASNPAEEKTFEEIAPKQLF